MHSYKIRFVAAFTHMGREYPDTYMLVLICSRGLRWDGGDFPSRAAAEAEGERRTVRRAA